MKKYILVLILSLPLLSAGAEINVEITPIGLGEGMAQLESMVNIETADAAEEIENLVRTYTAKPLLFSAMSNSANTTSSILPLCRPFTEDFAIFTGSSASFTSDNFDFEALAEQLGTFSVENDIYIGAALQAFSIYLTVPGDFITENLSFTAGAGYLSFDYETVSLASSAVHLSTSYSFFSNTETALFSWSGIHLQAGLSLSNNTISTVYSLEDVLQTFPIDPDGTGPIVPFYVTISLSPDVNITYQNTQFSIPFALSTGINIIDTFLLSIGAGAVVSFGQNSLEINVNDEITVEGYLADLIETSPRVIVSGSEPGAIADILTPIIFGTFSFSIGGFYLNLPVSWDLSDTLTAGITIGAGF
ncbi:MAG: hypothetical protein JEZ04_22420 [Spirochaetales bacterium]|nr:hypothetical protein [Spirochaetales bacterium]